MKAKALILVLCFAVLVTSIVSCDRAGGDSVAALTWLHDWDEAKDKAQAENKPIMINFYTDVCPACRKLDQNTFTDVELGAYLDENFVTLKNNAAKGSLYADYDVIAVPTTVFTQPDGEFIGEIRGYYLPGPFREGAQAALDLWDDIDK